MLFELFLMKVIVYYFIYRVGGGGGGAQSGLLYPFVQQYWPRPPFTQQSG